MRNAGGILWLLTMGALGSWCAVMALDREPPYEYLDATAGSKIVPNPAKAGSIVSSDWHLTKVIKDCPRTVERIFTNRDSGEVITTLDATPLTRVIRTSEHTLSRSFILPLILPEKVNYHVITSFECNPMQWFFPIKITSPKLPIDIKQ